MTVLLGTLVLVGRVLLVLILVVLVLAVVLLLAPVGLAVRWTPEFGIVVQACAGPVRRMLYPWRHHQEPPKNKPDKKAEKEPAKATAKPASAPPASAVPPGRQAPEASAAAVHPAPSASGPQSTPQDSGAAAPEGEPEPPLPPVGPEPEELTPGEQDALLGAARLFFGALAPYRARLLKGVQVDRLQVFWTVTGEDAADTAVAYGRRIALSNNLLTLARQYLTIRAQSLRLEPDFTGTLAEKRIFSCQIRTRPYIILMILFYLMRRDKQGRSPLEQIQDKLAALT